EQQRLMHSWDGAPRWPGTSFRPFVVTPCMVFLCSHFRRRGLHSKCRDEQPSSRSCEEKNRRAKKNTHEYHRFTAPVTSSTDTPVGVFPAFPCSNETPGTRCDSPRIVREGLRATLARSAEHRKRIRT